MGPPPSPPPPWQTHGKRRLPLRRNYATIFLTALCLTAFLFLKDPTFAIRNCTSTYCGRHHVSCVGWILLLLFHHHRRRRALHPQKPLKDDWKYRFHMISSVSTSVCLTKIRFFSGCIQLGLWQNMVRHDVVLPRLGCLQVCLPTKLSAYCYVTSGST